MSEAMRVGRHKRNSQAEQPIFMCIYIVYYKRVHAKVLCVEKKNLFKKKREKKTIMYLNVLHEWWFINNNNTRAAHITYYNIYINQCI